MSTTVFAWLIALLGAPALWSLYLVLSRIPVRWFTPETDYVALGVSVLIGVVAIFSSALSRLGKVILCAVYAPVCAACLVFYSMFFLCAIAGDCL